jgi:hypothetical protein
LHLLRDSDDGSHPLAALAPERVDEALVGLVQQRWTLTAETRNGLRHEQVFDGFAWHLVHEGMLARRDA